MNIAIADRLVRLRSARGWTQEELAEKLDVSRQAVSKWERAEASPDIDKLIALSRLYGVTLDELLETGIAAADTPEGNGPPSGAQEKPAGEDAAPEWVQDGVTAVLLGDGGEELAALAGEDAPEFLPTGRRSAEWMVNRFPYPVLVALVYVALGFAGGWWHPAWLLFLTIPLYYLAGPGIDKAREAPGVWGSIHAFLLSSGLLPVLIASLYLAMGVLWGWWHPGWCVFLLLPLFYCLPEPSGRP
ncbi:MAG TPA: helix-turn-helix transcriptional regulator [Firmicutes bacterium]|nr:helix-turn-helix transcriptional regulator [Bacillota bacterium]